MDAQNAREILEGVAEKCGFESVGYVAANALNVRPEVRDMCASGKCQIFGHSWACPPACGTLDDFQKIIDGYDNCLVVQTVGQLEDDFDFETMMETEHTHKDRFQRFGELARETGIPLHLLAAGTCTICNPCTYPDHPCRFPSKRMSSMEAAGLLVSEVCTQADVPYNHGKETIAYTSCVLY